MRPAVVPGSAAKPTGIEGSTLTRVRWDRLGAARERVYRMSTADDFPLIVTSTEAGVSGDQAVYVRPAKPDRVVAVSGFGR